MRLPFNHISVAVLLSSAVAPSLAHPQPVADIQAVSEHAAALDARDSTGGFADVKDLYKRKGGGGGGGKGGSGSSGGSSSSGLVFLSIGALRSTARQNPGHRMIANTLQERAVPHPAQAKAAAPRPPPPAGAPQLAPVSNPPMAVDTPAALPHPTPPAASPQVGSSPPTSQLALP